LISARCGHGHYIILQFSPLEEHARRGDPRRLNLRSSWLVWVARPSRWRIDDCTVVRSRFSPSISDVVTASASNRFNRELLLIRSAKTIHRSSRRILTDDAKRRAGTVRTIAIVPRKRKGARFAAPPGPPESSWKPRDARRRASPRDSHAVNIAGTGSPDASY